MLQYIVYCGWLAFELVFIMRYLIETKGRTLEETAALFDGESMPEDLQAEGEAAATMSRTRMPPIYQETTVQYEKAAPSAGGGHFESYELDFKPTLPPVGASVDTFVSHSQSAESDALPLQSKDRR